MTTKTTWVRNLVRRLRLIHWPVEETSKGFQVFCPNDTIVQLHLTPSDGRSEANTMALLNAAGFAEAEMAHEKQKLIQRAATQTELKKAEAEDIQRAEKHAAALRRAAGIRTISVAELISPHPVPKNYERVLITPEIAEALLEINTDNRPIRRRDVEYWTEIIEAGDWLYTHQGIAVDNRGVLQDGQHRLTAIKNSGESVEMQVTVGLPQENFAVIDTGTKRSYGDVIYRYRLEDGRPLPNRNRVAATARVIYVYDRLPNASFRDRVSSATIEEIVQENGEEILAAYNRGQAVWNVMRANVTAAGAFVYLLHRELGTEHPKVVEFLDGLIRQVMLPEKDPRSAIRRQFLSPSSRKNKGYMQHFALLIVTWNKWIEGKEVYSISWRPSVQEFPRLILPSEEAGPEAAK